MNLFDNKQISYLNFKNSYELNLFLICSQSFEINIFNFIRLAVIFFVLKHNYINTKNPILLYKFVRLYIVAMYFQKT